MKTSSRAKNIYSSGDSRESGETQFGPRSLQENVVKSAQGESFSFFPLFPPVSAHEFHQSITLAPLWT